MKNKNKKQYSWQEKITYHTLRSSNIGISARKKSYSRGWIEGFDELHSKRKLRTVKYELLKRRQSKIPFSAYDCLLLGYKNGLNSQIKSFKR